MRTSLGFSAALVAASGLAALGSTAPAQGASQCRPAGWSEVTRSTKGRVLIRGEQFIAADGRPGIRDTPERGRKNGEAVGCLFADGKLRPLFPTTDSAIDALSTFVMTGFRVAYFADYTDSGSNADAYAEVIVDDLRREEVESELRYLPDFQDAVSSNSSADFVAARIALDGEGGVAWVACPKRGIALCRFRGTGPAREVHARKPRGALSRRLARGKTIDVDRLSLKGGTVTWKQDGRARSAGL